MTKAKKTYKFDRIDYFDKILFRDDLAKNEHYTVEYFNKETGKPFQKHYKTLQAMNIDIDKYRYYNNVFVSLATTDGQGRTKENLVSRGVLAFDFDKKDYPEGFNHKDVLKKFQKLGLYYHMMVSSGRGYHVYLMTEPTKDIDRLVSINKVIAQRLGADMNATSPTQILRVPDSYNFKEGKQRQCNIIWLQANPRKRIEHSIDKLHKKYISSVGDANIRYVPTNKMEPCIEKMLKGVPGGHRNFALGRLTKWLQRANYSRASAIEVIREWNSKCSPPQDMGKVENDFSNYWNNDYKLLGCKTDNKEIQGVLSNYCNKYECNKADKYEAIHLLKTVNIEYKVADKIRYGGDRAMLNGNHITIIAILKVNDAGLNTKQLQEEITSTITRKSAMSKPTLYKVLNELEELNIIECIESRWKNESNFYKLKDMKALENEKFVLSYQAVQRYLDGAIGQAALRLYSYMLYRLSAGYNVVQEEIARELNITQQAVAKQIKELEEARYLIVHTDYSVNRLGANIYEWIA